MLIGPGMRRTLATIAVARFRLLETVEVMVHGRAFSLPAGSAVDVAAWYEDGIIRTDGVAFDGCFSERLELRDDHGTTVCYADLRSGWLVRSEAISVQVG
jgi:hypothetical protein